MFPRLCSRHATSQNYPFLIDYPSDIRSVLPDIGQAAVEFADFCAAAGFAKSSQGMVLDRVYYTIPGTTIKLFTGTFTDRLDPRNNNLPLSVEKLINDWLVGGRAGIASPLSKLPILKHLKEVFVNAEQAALPTWAPQRCVFSFPHVDGHIYYFNFDPTFDQEKKTSYMRFSAPPHPDAANLSPCMFFPEVINDNIMASVLCSPLFPDCTDPRFPDVRIDMVDSIHAPHWFDGEESFATPVFNKILSDQFCGRNVERNDPEYPMFVVAVVAALMGRWLRPVNTSDFWTKLLFFLGEAGTGKSLLLMFMRQWLPAHRIANLSSNMEKGFGLDGFQNCWAVLGDELRGSIGIAVAALLGMTSGDTVKMAIKNKTAIDVPKWKAAIAGTGNEMVHEFVDVKGSWARRLLIVPCNVVVPVEQRDDRLKKDAPKEAGFVLLKCAAAYRAMLEWLAATNTQFDNFIDNSWFTEQAKNLLDSKAKLDEFLDSGPVVFDMIPKEMEATRIYMPIDELGKLYRHWCQRRNYFVKGSWNAATYGNSFNVRNIVLPRDEFGLLNANKEWPQGSGLHRNTVFVLGVDLDADASKDDIPEYLHEKLGLFSVHRANVHCAADAARAWRKQRHTKRARDVAATVDDGAAVVAGDADETAASAAPTAAKRLAKPARMQ